MYRVFSARKIELKVLGVHAMIALRKIEIFFRNYKVVFSLKNTIGNAVKNSSTIVYRGTEDYVGLAGSSKFYLVRCVTNGSNATTCASS